MAYKAYDFTKHFDYIAEVLGYEVTYDNLSLALDSRLFLRNERTVTTPRLFISQITDSELFCV